MEEHIILILDLKNQVEEAGKESITLEAAVNLYTAMLNNGFIGKEEE